MQLTRYEVKTPRADMDLRMAVVADLHDHQRSRVAVLRLLEQARPDMILVPGDLTEELTEPPDGRVRPGLQLLRELAEIAPTFYAFGNHETGACHANVRRAERLGLPPMTVHPAYLEQVQNSGAIFLNDSYTVFRGMAIGGQSTGLWNKGRVPDVSWLDDFCHNKAFKLLLCHHPEYYERYLRDRDIDLIVSGHAHGGQWRIFGRGVYAPDQHFFPKYTSGVHDGRLVISRGTSNNVPFAPRFFNPCEVVMIHVTGA